MSGNIYDDLPGPDGKTCPAWIIAGPEGGFVLSCSLPPDHRGAHYDPDALGADDSGLTWKPGEPDCVCEAPDPEGTRCVTCGHVAEPARP